MPQYPFKQVDVFRHLRGIQVGLTVFVWIQKRSYYLLGVEIKRSNVGTSKQLVVFRHLKVIQKG